MSAEYEQNWMVPNSWNVVRSEGAGPISAETLHFTPDMTVERWKDGSRVEVWATGCTLTSDGLRGTTLDAPRRSFIIVRSGKTLTCTFEGVVSRRKQIRAIASGSLLGGLTGFLAGFVAGSPVLGVAIGLIASLTGSLTTTVWAMPAQDGSAGGFVAEDGEGGRLIEPATPPLRAVGN